MTAIRTKRSLAARAADVFLSDYFIFYLCIAFIIVLAPFLPVLIAPANAVNIMSNMWPLLIVAIGQTFVLAIGGIDLSQGAVMAVTAVIGAMLITLAVDPVTFMRTPLWGLILTEQGGPLAGVTGGVLLALVMMLLAAVLIGLFNGASVALFDLPPFMVTLVTMMTLSAFALWLTQSGNIANLPDDFTRLGRGDLVSVYFGAKEESQLARRQVYSFVTFPMVIALIMAFLAHIILNRTVFGARVLAIGMNRKAAVISGIPVRRIVIAVFVLSAVCAMIGGLLYSARLEAGRPTLGGGTFLLDVIAASVIGGTSLFGGKAKIIWTFFGVLFYVLMSSALSAMNLSAFQIDMVKGGIILGAALLDVFRTWLKRERLQ
ncbi:ABC transporter permease [Devosia submarina]|uniref:ABC transporter permease n=1 Tax=Devosia submarina TaxID=1173082 RepID=UPI000D33DB37|nr:ABC transporter permease [Devosia submarina]